MQRGTIRQHHGAWTLFYYDDVLIDGKRARRYTSKKLAPVGGDYPTKRSVLLLA